MAMPRTLNRLGNAKQVAAIKAKGWHGDGKGLYLRIQPSGGRSWVLVSTVGGKRKEKGLGSAAKVTLAEARKRRDELLKPQNSPAAAFRRVAERLMSDLEAEWRDPQRREQWRASLAHFSSRLVTFYLAAITAEEPSPVLRRIAGSDNNVVVRRRRRSSTVFTIGDDGIPQPASPSAPTVPLFGDFADEFIKGQREGWKNAKHREQWETTLATHAAPLRAMRVDAITTDDVLAVLRPIWSTANETASRLRGRIERILAAAAAKGFRDPDKRNPATWHGHLEHFLHLKRKGEKGHHGAIPWRAMPAFWRALATRPGSSSVEALRFTILTAARTGETIGARWREISPSRKVWTIPAERMKAGVPHEVPLSNAAMDLLARLNFGVAPDEFIFPGIRLGSPLSQMAMLKLLKRDMGRPETVHGFRSSFRDWAGDATDFPRELAEQALAHVIGDKAEQAYRRGTAIEKRRPLMEAWAGYLMGA